MSSPSSPHSATTYTPSPYSAAPSIFDERHPAVMSYPGSSQSPSYTDLVYPHEADSTFFTYPSTMAWPKQNHHFSRQDSWPHFSNYPSEHMSQSSHRVELDMLKTEGLSYPSSGSPTSYNRNIFDMSFTQAAQPSYSHILGSFYPTPASPQAHLHDGYIQPVEISPDSPLSQDYPHSPDSLQSGCDPRHVSGMMASAAPAGRQSVDSFRSGSRERDDEDGFNGKDDDSYAEDSFDDYDDDDDGDYVSGRRRSSAKRNTRRVSDRYSPYDYPSSAAYQDDTLGFATRARRTGSDATSESSSSSSQRRRPPPTLSVPVPVPNLTKKSRGRHVPTAGQEQKRAMDGKARVHTCKVPGCGKCFARGEHLKRHVRSIHTHEKPHKCPFPGCGKDFSRHDNLGQHMRVHKGYRG